MEVVKNLSAEVISKSWEYYWWLNVDVSKFYIDIAFMIWICAQNFKHPFRTSPLYSFFLCICCYLFSGFIQVISFGTKLNSSPFIETNTEIGFLLIPDYEFLTFIVIWFSTFYISPFHFFIQSKLGNFLLEVFAGLSQARAILVQFSIAKMIVPNYLIAQILSASVAGSGGIACLSLEAQIFNSPYKKRIFHSLFYSFKISLSASILISLISYNCDHYIDQNCAFIEKEIAWLIISTYLVTVFVLDLLIGWKFDPFAYFTHIWKFIPSPYALSDINFIDHPVEKFIKKSKKNNNKIKKLNQTSKLKKY